MRLRVVGAFGLAVVGAVAAQRADATEGGASLYVPGIRGPLAGFIPPPGFYFQNDFYTYNGELGGTRQTQIGGAVVARIKVQAPANFATPTWVTPVEILGGNLAFSVTVPFGLPRVSAGALIEAPRLDRTFNFKLRDGDLNFGDPVVSSFVGWHAGKFHWNAGVGVNIPAGAYQEGELSNLAFNRPIGDVFAGLTYLDQDLGLDLSGAIGFEINGTNDATDYRSGNAFHADFAATKFLSKEFQVGLLAAYYRQVTGDGGSGNGIGPFKGEVLAFGASAAYTFEVGHTPVTARVRVLREVETENRTQGTIGIFTLSLPLLPSL